jgi:hypothetical protein
MLDGALKTIAVSMANCEFYASVFADSLNRHFTSPETSAAWGRQLQRALPEFYAAVVVFSIKAKSYFKPSTLGTANAACIAYADGNIHIEGRINKPLRPFSVGFKAYLAEIENKEKTLRELANMATMDGIKGLYVIICILASATDHVVLTDMRQKLEIVGEMRELFAQISDKEALTWLGANSPNMAYDFNKYRRLEGTCEWIFQTQKYQSWIDGTGNRDLWVVGIPGEHTSLFPPPGELTSLARCRKIGTGHKSHRRAARTG